MKCAQKASRPGKKGTMQGVTVLPNESRTPSETHTYTSTLQY